MRDTLCGINLDGITVDLGSGRRQEYLSYIHLGEKFSLKSVDQKGTPDTPPTDLEHDTLPFHNGSVDAILMMNILEHIFNYEHALKEAVRVMRHGAVLVGVVPFFCHYHNGPRDFFRYTHEALERIFTHAGFSAKFMKEIVPLGIGPVSVGFHCLHLVFSKRIRRRFRLFFLALLPIPLCVDAILKKISPDVIKNFPLGYRFLLIKK